MAPWGLFVNLRAAFLSVEVICSWKEEKWVFEGLEWTTWSRRKGFCSLSGGMGISFRGTGMVLRRKVAQRPPLSLHHEEVTWGFCPRERCLRSKGGSRGRRARSLERAGSGTETNIANFHHPNGWLAGEGKKGSGPVCCGPPFAFQRELPYRVGAGRRGFRLGLWITFFQ